MPPPQVVTATATVTPGWDAAPQTVQSLSQGDPAHLRRDAAGGHSDVLRMLNHASAGEVPCAILCYTSIHA